MNTHEKVEFSEFMASIFEIYNAKLTPQSGMIWLSLMNNYPLSSVKDALLNHVQHSVFAPKPADMINFIKSQDGRPSADEAWAMIPRNESVSAVLSQDMLTAMSSAQPLLDEGDQVAARMAFKESYTRLITAARNNSVPVAWFPSLGDDKNGREAVVQEAVRLGRISGTHAQRLLPKVTNYTELMRLS